MYELILIPVLVGIITQALKLITDGIPNNLSWQHLLSDYGGMPSAHTAFVASLATVIGLQQGFNSATFAISFVLMIIVMRDALGFRREIGRNSVFTNLLAQEVFKRKPKNTKNKIEFLNETVGHKFDEVLMGFIVGVSTSIMIFYLIMII